MNNLLVQGSETGKKLSNYFGWWGRVIFYGDQSYI